jgi:membrane associated rhomboid family serine protease
VVVGIGLYGYADYLDYYVGLSGVLHGLLLVAPFVSPFYSRVIAGCFLLVIVSKVVWEQSSWYDDMAMAGMIGGRVEANAHLLGVIAGLIFLLVYYVHAYLQEKIDGKG